MKKLLLFFLLFNFFAFGQKNIDIKLYMKKSILKYNKEHLKDPSSYQLITLTILSTETLGDMSAKLLEEIPIALKSINEEIEKNNSVILLRKEKIKEFKEKGDKEVEIEDCLETIRVYEADNIKQNDSKKEWELIRKKTEKDLGNKYIAYYYVEHKYRAKNSYGGFDIQTDVIKFDSSFNIKGVE
ncbi:hypothetical protein [Flavobacterium sp. LM4]|uniref:hypothetical protein n=1 Tax=Flavobacterium sp. LM4 TaxID=1938609 RepID=UPI000993465C|nr:hypothetical protein [Flavobacterium sp. LM4]OOV19773.1 hypothetical protein BXU10_09095 [Flavobacterium sp. LM4]